MKSESFKPILSIRYGWSFSLARWLIAAREEHVAAAKQVMLVSRLQSRRLNEALTCVRLGRGSLPLWAARTKACSSASVKPTHRNAFARILSPPHTEFLLNSL